MSARLLLNSNAKTPGEAPSRSCASKPAAAAALVAAGPHLQRTLCLSAHKMTGCLCAPLPSCSALLLPHWSAASNRTVQSWQEEITQSWHRLVTGQGGLLLSNAECLQGALQLRLQGPLQLCLCTWTPCLTPLPAAECPQTASPTRTRPCRRPVTSCVLRGASAVWPAWPISQRLKQGQGREPARRPQVSGRQHILGPWPSRQPLRSPKPSPATKTEPAACLAPSVMPACQSLRVRCLPGATCCCLLLQCRSSVFWVSAGHVVCYHAACCLLHPSGVPQHLIQGLCSQQHTNKADAGTACLLRLADSPLSWEAATTTVAAGAKAQAASVPDGLMSSTDASSKMAHLVPASIAPSNAAAAPTTAQPEPHSKSPSAFTLSALMDMGLWLPGLLALSSSRAARSSAFHKLTLSCCGALA